MKIRRRPSIVTKENGYTDKEVEIRKNLEKEADQVSEKLDALENEPPTITTRKEIIKHKKQYNRFALNVAYWGVHPSDVPIDDLKIMLRTPNECDSSTEKAYRDALGDKPKLKRAVRTFCILCTGGSQKEVSQCSATNCPLWPFRMGTNPFSNRRGIVPKGFAKNANTGSEDDIEEEDDGDAMILDVEDDIAPADKQ